MNPRDVRAVRFPTYAMLSIDAQNFLEHARILNNGHQGRLLYDDLDARRRAGLLNIIAKAKRTRVANGQRIFDYFEILREVRGDRIFVTVTRSLPADLEKSTHRRLLRRVSDLLHRPWRGFRHLGSWKTPDAYGNLQVTLFSDGDSLLADVDIDDAAGLAHVAQVTRNLFTGCTDPYDIHEILMEYQKLDAGYRLVVDR